MKFFFDNNLSPRICYALRELEDRKKNEVEHIADRFPRNTPDVDWMEVLGKEGGWIVLTCDKNINKNPHEVKAWKESGLSIFFLREAWLRFGFWEQAWQLIKKWPLIKKEAERFPAATLFEVNIRSQEIRRLN